MIHVCNDNESPTLSQRHALGTEMIVLIVSFAVQMVVICYILYKLLFSCNCKQDSEGSRKTKLQLIFRFLVLTYHISSLLLLSSCVMTIIPIMFGLSNDYDISSSLSCFLYVEVPYLPVGTAYVSMILFWFLRLKLVFKGSVYTTSKTFNIIFAAWIVTAWIITSSLILIVVCMTLIDVNNVFCKYRIKVVDFIPYLYNDENYSYSYSYKLNNFYFCTIKTNNQLYLFVTIATAIAAITVPLANLVSFYLYVSKMRANVNNAKHANNEYQRSRIMHVYFTAIVGVISILSTLVTIILRIVSSVFSSIVYVDVVLNGILMLMVLDFGKWLVCRCCLRLIAKRIWKIEQHTARLSIQNNSI